jgi:hypothetical protein
MHTTLTSGPRPERQLQGRRAHRHSPLQTLILGLRRLGLGQRLGVLDVLGRYVPRVLVRHAHDVLRLRLPFPGDVRFSCSAFTSAGVKGAGTEAFHGVSVIRGEEEGRQRDSLCLVAKDLG